MVRNCDPKWGASMHRFGHKFDHGLLRARWRWKTKKTQRYETADYTAMTDQSWDEFDCDLRIRIEEKQKTRVQNSGHIGQGNLPTQKDLSQELGTMTTCIQETIKTAVPKKKNMKKKGREVSKETMELHEKRTKAFRKHYF